MLTQLFASWTTAVSRAVKIGFGVIGAIWLTKGIWGAVAAAAAAAMANTTMIGAGPHREAAVQDAVLRADAVRVEVAVADAHHLAEEEKEEEEEIERRS
mmetsp:Transcript_96559/g.185409  ORF Transcript_96559/g.185409 Transcript_96559/m.185409 type:complete len:99 (+) Transcript_96559:392-688(+)